LRTSVSAVHSAEQIDQAVATIAAVGRSLGLPGQAALQPGLLAAGD
jgi:hypothetical protein